MNEPLGFRPWLMTEHPILSPVFILLLKEQLQVQRKLWCFRQDLAAGNAVENVPAPLGVMLTLMLDGLLGEGLYP